MPDVMVCEDVGDVYVALPSVDVRVWRWMDGWDMVVRSKLSIAG